MTQPSSPNSVTLSEEVALKVDGINKRFHPDTWANRDVSFSAMPGEIVGILGPNGAGKTTLMRQITAELMPTSGEVTVLGTDVISDPLTAKTLMGIMPQEVALFDHLTVLQHLSIFAKLRGLSKSDAHQRADQVAMELGLSDHVDSSARDISGGMKRRLLVGIAILAKPPILVLDEPTAGLDPEARQILWTLIRKYRASGTTVLLTTHYMEEAEMLCDRVGIMLSGRLLTMDTVPGLKTRNGFEFKATFSYDSNGEEISTIYGSSESNIINQMKDEGVQNFTLSRTSLEDLYLAITDGRLEVSAQ